ncbi:MAG: DEAD/DEAH box helicase [Candidatus Heimdallarchaeota archaeon]|nr:DEAD/DEAH box helicase [Candidatus Heimdallarchaeota archaeon]
MLDFPELIDGTTLELGILSIKEPHSTQPEIIEVETGFDSLKLLNSINRALSELGYTEPTPIQSQAIPIAMEGKDILGTAQTGSGKTAAFALPTIDYLESTEAKNKNPRALILSPTRELANQIGESINGYAKYTKVKQVTIYGGVSQKPQEKEIKKGFDILVATPGRLIDLVQQQIITLENIEILILDEADRMLDMGFINDIRRIIGYIPYVSQVMLFSATMPNQILELANDILIDPRKVSVDPPASTVETVESLVFFVEKQDKLSLLLHLLKNDDIPKALIFMRTKYGANKMVKKLKQKGFSADAIHGNKSQSAREKAMEQFQNDKIAILVATDIAARGIDIDDISHVINYDMSNEAEIYVHRIGRTARAGKSGIAYNFCDVMERKYLVDIEYLTGEHLIRAHGYPYQSDIQEPEYTDIKPKKQTRKHTSKKQKASIRS